MSTAYDAESFIQELGQLKSDLEIARRSTEAITAYRESLPKTWPVDANGRHYDVPTDPLASRLMRAEKRPEDRNQQIDEARKYLDALAAEASSLSGRPLAGAGNARSALDAILAGSEYKHSEQENWYQKFRRRVNEIILDAIERIFRRAGGQKSFGYALWWIGVCAAAILIAYWVFRNWFQTARAQEMALRDAAIPARSWQEWVFGARDAAGRGDYRMAVHCAYWAGITRLQDTGALAPDRAKTPREYLRALAKDKAVMPEILAARREALSLLTSRLERTWYGYQAATESDFRDSLTQLETLGCRLL